MRIKQLIIGLAASLFALPAFAQQPQLPPGWRMDGSVASSPCLASGTRSGEAQVAIAPNAGGYLLVFTGPEFPREKTSLPVTLSLDGSAPSARKARASDGVVGVQIGGALAASIGAGSRLTLTTQGRAYTFDVKGARTVMDAVARCAHQPNLVEIEKSRPPLIPGAGEWRLVANMPSAPGACSARVNGPEADTVMLLARDGVLVFGPAHPDWEGSGAEAKVAVAIDGGPAETVTALSLSNLVLTRVEDKGLVARLRKAKTLDWTLPNGRFHTEVAGLGAALDRITACQPKAPAS
jgi:hypothetical protein